MDLRLHYKWCWEDPGVPAKLNINMFLIIPFRPHSRVCRCGPASEQVCDIPVATQGCVWGCVAPFSVAVARMLGNCVFLLCHASHFPLLELLTLWPLLAKRQCTQTVWQLLKAPSDRVVAALQRLQVPVPRRGSLEQEEMQKILSSQCYDAMLIANAVSPVACRRPGWHH